MRGLGKREKDTDRQRLGPVTRPSASLLVGGGRGGGAKQWSNTSGAVRLEKTRRTSQFCMRGTPIVHWPLAAWPLGERAVSSVRQAQLEMLMRSRCRAWPVQEQVQVQVQVLRGHPWMDGIHGGFQVEMPAQATGALSWRSWCLSVRAGTAQFASGPGPRVPGPPHRAGRRWRLPRCQVPYLGYLPGSRTGQYSRVPRPPSTVASTAAASCQLTRPPVAGRPTLRRCRSVPGHDAKVTVSKLMARSARGW